MFNRANGTNLSQFHAAAIGSQALDKLRRIFAEAEEEIDDYTESR